MNQQSLGTSPANGASSSHELFALTDEQILEIEPEAQDVEVRGGESATAADNPAVNVKVADSSQNQTDGASTIAESASTAKTQTSVNATEPPAWLAAQMKDPWNGDAARELWDGVQLARQEAAAYREVFAKPEEARTAAERARALDDIDRAYFGAQGSGPEQARAARAQLAAAMLREDPAAFREMVFEGLRALEQANLAGSSSATSSIATAIQQHGQNAAGSAPRQASVLSSNNARGAEQEGQLSAYAAFEKAANEDLEKSVGGTIERTLHQALPNAGRVENAALTTRLAATIRQDVEKALQGDRQLGEQVAQVLAGRRLDNETRAQVVRLINDRAQQLVPVAAKRVLSDWTQTTLAAHRGKSARNDAASTRREVASSSPVPTDLQSKAREIPRPVMQNEGRSTGPRRVDYAKLSDEQILNL